MSKITPDCYIVRVYRRETSDDRDLVGIVELVESQEQRAFKTLDELREILSPATKRKRAETRGKRAAA